MNQQQTYREYHFYYSPSVGVSVVEQNILLSMQSDPKEHPHRLQWKHQEAIFWILSFSWYVCPLMYDRYRLFHVQKLEVSIQNVGGATCVLNVTLVDGCSNFNSLHWILKHGVAPTIGCCLLWDKFINLGRSFPSVCIHIWSRPTLDHYICECTGSIIISMDLVMSIEFIISFKDWYLVSISSWKNLCKPELVFASIPFLGAGGAPYIMFENHVRSWPLLETP